MCPQPGNLLRALRPATNTNLQSSEELLKFRLTTWSWTTPPSSGLHHTYSGLQRRCTGNAVAMPMLVQEGCGPGPGGQEECAHAWTGSECVVHHAPESTNAAAALALLLTLCFTTLTVRARTLWAADLSGCHPVAAVLAEGRALGFSHSPHSPAPHWCSLPWNVETYSCQNSPGSAFADGTASICEASAHCRKPTLH
jgi:hypothetical protein